MPRWPKSGNYEQSRPSLKLVRVVKAHGWERDVYGARIRMPDGKTFRWTEQIPTHTGWPQEQAAQPTTYYDIPGYGSVQYGFDALNYLLERMEEHPEEFERMHVRGTQ